MSFPLDSDALAIFMHLFGKYAKVLGRKIPPELAAEIPSSLDSYQQHILTNLKRDIYRTQLKYFREKLKQEKEPSRKRKPKKESPMIQKRLI